MSMNRNTKNGLIGGIPRGQAVDLHTHSYCSDGTVSPAQLVEMAASLGLKAMALTDHDTVAGIPEALAAADRLAAQAASSGTAVPEIIPGVEISSEINGYDIHIVGLYPDWQNQKLQDALASFAGERDRRNRKICERLQEDGYDISYEELTRRFPDTVITRGQFALLLVEKHYAKDTRDVFENFLGEHCKYYVNRKMIYPWDAVRLIREHHGIPILAHPMKYKLSQAQMSRFLEFLTQNGLLGIEVYYSTHTRAEQRYLLHLAEHFGLLVSGGSDFHGDAKPGLQMMTGYGDLFVPASVLRQIHDARDLLHHKPDHF